MRSDGSASKNHIQIPLVGSQTAKNFAVLNPEYTGYVTGAARGQWKCSDDTGGSYVSGQETALAVLRHFPLKSQGFTVGALVTQDQLACPNQEKTISGIRFGPVVGVLFGQNDNWFLRPFFRIGYQLASYRGDLRENYFSNFGQGRSSVSSLSYRGSGMNTVVGALYRVTNVFGLSLQSTISVVGLRSKEDSGGYSEAHSAAVVSLDIGAHYRF